MVQKYDNIHEEIDKIIGTATAGNPEKVIWWTTKSLRNRENALHEKGFDISHDTIGRVLKEMGYSLQQNQKMVQVGMPHPDRNSQFEYINNRSGECIR